MPQAVNDELYSNALSQFSPQQAPNFGFTSYVRFYTCADTTTAGQVCYIDLTNTAHLARADSAVNCSGILGISYGGISGQQATFLCLGYWNNALGFIVGQPVYLSDTVWGGLQQNAPTNPNSVIRSVGYTPSYGILSFNLGGLGVMPGPTGDTGSDGPNTVTTSTTTPITGLLAGNGTTVYQAVANTDYTNPSGLATALTAYTPTSSLGSAAFRPTTAFDASGAAATAQSNAITTSEAYTNTRLGGCVPYSGATGTLDLNGQNLWNVGSASIGSIYSDNFHGQTDGAGFLQYDENGGITIGDVFETYMGSQIIANTGGIYFNGNGNAVKTQYNTLDDGTGGAIFGNGTSFMGNSVKINNYGELSALMNSGGNASTLEWGGGMNSRWPTLRMYGAAGQLMFNMQDVSGASDCGIELFQNSTGNSFGLSGYGFFDATYGQQILTWNHATSTTTLGINYGSGGLILKTPQMTIDDGVGNTTANSFKKSGGTANQILLASGATNPLYKGTSTLVSGTKAVTVSGVTTSNNAFVQLTTPGGTLGGMYKAVCTTNTLTITSVSTTGITVTTDTSTLNYVIF